MSDERSNPIEDAIDKLWTRHIELAELVAQLNTTVGEHIKRTRALSDTTVNFAEQVERAVRKLADLERRVDELEKKVEGAR